METGAGTYNAANAAYSAVTPALAALPCPVGFYCKTGDHLLLFQPCPIGYIRATTGATDFKAIGTADTATDCTKCAATFACTVPGASALPPMKLNGGATDDVGQCSAGYFCKEGATLTQPNTRCADHTITACF